MDVEDCKLRIKHFPECFKSYFLYMVSSRRRTAELLACVCTCIFPPHSSDCSPRFLLNQSRCTNSGAIHTVECARAGGQVSTFKRSLIREYFLLQWQHHCTLISWNCWTDKRPEHHHMLTAVFVCKKMSWVFSTRQVAHQKRQFDKYYRWILHKSVLFPSRCVWSWVSFSGHYCHTRLLLSLSIPLSHLQK